ncbi:MAG TPA: pilus assembly protein PilP [Candidatus Acidoferrales bacterium]|nr:pilus assembly protein PilP [Candidatus Acidoferrales bacterium]
MKPTSPWRSHPEPSVRRAARGGLVLLMLLTGCSADTSDLDAYFAEVKARKTTDIEAVPQMRPYERFVYLPDGRRSPFDNPETEVPRQLPNNGLSPDLRRARQPLEEFPIDALRMLGMLSYGEKRWALVRTADGVIHRVAVGQYLGRNNGRVIAISEREIRLKEIVPDGLGGWMQRDAAIALSE